MKWDAVERELFVIHTQLHRLGDSFGALACALREERNAGTQVFTRGPESNEKDKNQDGAQPLPLPILR